MIWSKALKKIGGSVIGSAVGGFFKSYGIWIAIAAAAGALATVVIYVHGAEQAKGQVIVLTERMATQKADFDEAIAGHAANLVALDQCLDANAYNSLEAAYQANRAETAATNVAALRAELERHTGEIHADSEALRGKDQECRSVDEPLPNWFTDGLWDD
jgi:hypothetical protein